jgi:hypothetical protein
MYHLFKDDPWGNKIPIMTVSSEDTATRLMKNGKDYVTQVLEVPRNKSTIIKM